MGNRTGSGRRAIFQADSLVSIGWSQIGPIMDQQRCQANCELSAAHFGQRDGRIAAGAAIGHAAFARVDLFHRLGQVAVERERIPRQIQVSVDPQRHVYFSLIGKYLSANARACQACA